MSIMSMIHRHNHRRQWHAVADMRIWPRLPAPRHRARHACASTRQSEGSIRLLTDASANVVNRYDYDSFGRRLSVIESLPNQPYGWKAREWFPDIELLYNRARWYVPVLGRFTSEDPLGKDSEDFNLYTFAWNNPQNWSDPTGLQSVQGDIIRSALDEAEAARAAAAAAAASKAGGGGASGEYAALSAQAVAQRTQYAVIGLKIACSLNVIADSLTALNSNQIPIPNFQDCSADTVCDLLPAENPHFSFAGGTLVSTAFGSKRIEDVAVGDLIAARDQFTGVINWRPVRELFRRTSPSISLLGSGPIKFD